MPEMHLRAVALTYVPCDQMGLVKPHTASFFQNSPAWPYIDAYRKDPNVWRTI